MAKTKPDKHPKLAVEAALCHNAYNEFGLKAPNTAGETHTTTVTTMRDTGALICLVSRCKTMRMEIRRHNLAKTTKTLVGANGGQIDLDT